MNWKAKKGKVTTAHRSPAHVNGASHPVQLRKFAPSAPCGFARRGRGSSFHLPECPRLLGDLGQLGLAPGERSARRGSLPTSQPRRSPLAAVGTEVAEGVCPPPPFARLSGLWGPTPEDASNRRRAPRPPRLPRGNKK